MKKIALMNYYASIIKLITKSLNFLLFNFQKLIIVLYEFLL